MTRSKPGWRFRSVLCPVDLSEQSRAALRYAADIARRARGRLTALFVSDPLLLAAAAAVYHRRQEFVQQTQEELERFVTQSVRSSRLPRSRIACTVSVGDPAAEILRGVKRFGSDLIVMGTHGLSGVNKLFIGSTTERVLRRVTVPVFAVPVKARSSRRTPLARVPAIARVLAPVDLTDGWEDDARAAAEVARWFAAELMLLHVVPRIQMPPWLRTDVAAHDRLRIAKAREMLEQVRATLPSGIRSACRVVLGKPADEIARVAVKGPPCLVVMALRGEDGFFRVRRGSIAYRVLTHAVAPVLALPGRPQARQSRPATSTKRTPRAIAES